MQQLILCPLIPAKNCTNAIMDYDGMRDAGSSLGTGGMIVVLIFHSLYIVNQSKKLFLTSQ